MLKEDLFLEKEIINTNKLEYAFVNVSINDEMLRFFNSWHETFITFTSFNVNASKKMLYKYRNKDILPKMLQEPFV